MKIALIYDCIYPYVKGGGEKRYFDIAQRLKHKHDIHLFGMKFWKGPDVINKNNITYHGVCKPLKLYIKNRRSIKQAIYFGIKLFRPLFKEKFDLIDCSASPYFPVFPAWLYSKIRKTPLTITWFEYWGKYWYKYLGIFGIFGRIIEELALKMSSNIISISQLTQKRIKKRSKVLPVGIEIKYPNIEEEVQIKYDIIFAGRLIKDKNVDTLIRAIKIVRKEFLQIKCLIIGEGPEKTRLNKLVKKNNLEANIIFKNFLEDKQDLLKYLKSSKVFVLPSTREGFGIILCEANACGLPAITINHPENAAKDLIKENYNGFISEHDEYDLAQKIKKFLANKNIHNKLRNQSIQEAKKYNWDNIILDLEKHYTTISYENTSNSG